MKIVKKFLYEYYLLDLLQIAQFTIISLFLSIIVSIFSRYLFKFILDRPYFHESIVVEFVYICIQTIMIVVILILIRASMNNIPSLANMINKNYDGTYAFRTTLQIAIFFAMIELIPAYKYLFENFSRRIIVPDHKLDENNDGFISSQEIIDIMPKINKKPKQKVTGY